LGGRTGVGGHAHGGGECLFLSPRWRASTATGTGCTREDRGLENGAVEGIRVAERGDHDCDEKRKVMGNN